MKLMKAMLLGAALMAGSATLAVAQSVVPVQWGWGQRDDDDGQAYKDGFRRGQEDARRNRRFDPDDSGWRERDDRQAYRSGYERGFQQVGGYRNDRDGDRDRGVWGSGGYGVNSARQYGYQDGINDGARDRQTGHSDRPTQGGNYKHADHGYNSSFGNKNYYKQAYRQAYENGYQLGYKSGGGWRRY
ncbi:MAG TPA: hypothetical protein VGH51_20785 [Candidatus Angelobacter sp.]|jgi:translation initiation factor IF-2